MPTVTTVSTVSTMSAVSTVYSAVLPPSLMVFLNNEMATRESAETCKKFLQEPPFGNRFSLRSHMWSNLGAKLFWKDMLTLISIFLICAEKQKRSWKFNLDILWNVFTQSWGKVTLLLNIENRIKSKRIYLFFGNFVLNIFTHVLKFLRLYQR